MIGVFKSEADKAFKAYELAAGGLWSDYDFAHTFDASLVEEVSLHALLSPCRLFSLSSLDLSCVCMQMT